MSVEREKTRLCVVAVLVFGEIAAEAGGGRTQDFGSSVKERVDGG
jgi:hypothetical protein